MEILFSHTYPMPQPILSPPATPRQRHTETAAETAAAGAWQDQLHALREARKDRLVGKVDAKETAEKAAAALEARIREETAKAQVCTLAGCLWTLVAGEGGGGGGG